jgi:hypothetical protein
MRAQKYRLLKLKYFLSFIVQQGLRNVGIDVI